MLRDSIALVQVMCSYSSCPGHFSHWVSQKGYHISSLQGLGGGYRDILLRSHLIHRPAMRSVVCCCLQLLPHSGPVSAPKPRSCSSLGDLWAVIEDTRTGTETKLSPPISGFFHDPERFPGLAKTWSGLPGVYGLHMPRPASYSLPSVGQLPTNIFSLNFISASISQRPRPVQHLQQMQS